ncbi:hypothetical protein [Cellulomonas hominis]
MTSYLQDLPLRLFLDLPGYDPSSHDLSHLPCRPLVRSLALTLLDMANGVGPIKSPWTAKMYRTGISQFVRWLERQGFIGDLDAITVGHVYGFGAATLKRHDEQVVRRLLLATVDAGITPALQPTVVEHLQGEAVAPRFRSTPLAPYSVREFDSLVAACRDVIRAWDAERTLAAPTWDVVLAYRILLGLELGIPAESLTDLRVSGIRWQGDKEMRIEFVKQRADGPQALTLQVRGPWSGPGLLRRWLDVSTPMRARRGDLEDRVWLCMRAGRVESTRFQEHEWTAWRRSFLTRHHLRSDDGELLRLNLRRLRTTWTARKSKFWHGAVTVDPNHSATVEGDRYLTRSADPGEVDTLVEDAQADLMRRADHVALVLATDDELADQVDSPGATWARGQDEASSTAPWDMFAAACRDPFKSPFSPAGSFCAAAVWSCLVCPLAVITPSKLPALLRLHDFLQARSAAVTEREWVVAYAPAWVQLTTRVLPRFDDATLAAARAIVTNDEEIAMPAEPLWAP